MLSYQYLGWFGNFSYMYIHLLEKTQKVSWRKSAQMKENPLFPVKDIQILSLIVFSRQKKYL